MDQFSAHLDRGWDLVQRGDTRGAELSARRALELDKDAPEAYNLLGYVAALHGEFEEAMEHYQQAIALDDTYFEAILNAAEVLIHPLGELEEAERLCDDALELAETDEERIEALLLKFDTLLGQDQVEAAKELCVRFPQGPFDNPMHSFSIGRALYEIGDTKRAAPLIEAATLAPNATSEAHYYLGLLHDEADRPALATQSFLRSRRLDVNAPRPPWALEDAVFRELVEQAIAALPERARAWVTPDEVFVADLPGVEVIVDGVDPRALLLLDALTPDAQVAGAPVDTALARVFIYQRNVERLGGAPDAIVRELSSALQHELEATFSPPADVSLP